eukprot:CAMPEP_0201691806 /NCGR_PEP_ID=MMETSP0578-20130828/4860_1 /ASSEMBLY_ACC=CAM_ASM_000663 /TAXON_ID=267565 /ORGANISM="Skeletonema grethea, Strain CCMP 1804" /LENGTH=299 /DNA_ID=CAMNT_0048177069 /DNA_START=50 /DNA_END=949 /DNA_ORIENTATION=+
MPPLQKRKSGSPEDEDANDPLEHENSTGGQQVQKSETKPQPTLAPAPLPLLDTVNTFGAQTFTTDQGLKIIQWSSWAISYLTASSKHHKETLSPALRKLSGEVSFTRYVLRFYGFFQSLDGYRSGSWAGGSWDNPKIAKIAKYLMAGSMLFYYPLEHVAYAGWQLPTLSKFSRDNANKISALSCVFWTTYIISDFWASCLKWNELKTKMNDLGRLLATKKRDDDKAGMMEVEQERHAIAKKIRLVKLQVIRCLLFILPSVNWSLPNWATNPLLGELPLNGLMLAEAYTSVYQSLVGMQA